MTGIGKVRFQQALRTRACQVRGDAQESGAHPAGTGGQAAARTQLYRADRARRAPGRSPRVLLALRSVRLGPGEGGLEPHEGDQGDKAQGLKETRLT